MKPIDRRLKTLDGHIQNAEMYLRRRDIYKQYRQQKPRKQEAFYEAHRTDLTHYEAAERYLHGVMNGKTALPIKAWKAERDKLSRQYAALKDEVKEVEQIRKGVYNMLRQEQREQQPRRTQDMER